VKLLWFACIAPLLATDPKPFGSFMEFGGHRVHFSCQGKGSTVAVLLHGTPRFSFHFALIQPGIAKFTRVCTYDRAGDAWSAPLPGQPVAQQFVDELHQFLARVSPDTRVVLVGHSVGGVLARSYYAQHAGRGAAMFLIDTAPVPADRQTDEALRAMAASVRPQRQPEPTLEGSFAKLPKQFHPAHLWATRKWNEYAAGVDLFTALKYQADLNHMAAQAPKDGVPVWFLTRSEPANWLTTQQAMAGAWPNGKLVQVANTSHDIQLDQPAAVIAVVREAVTAAANRR
jgi:pimeloyl-ACP methyl ester carboxylesterase